MTDRPAWRGERHGKIVHLSRSGHRDFGPALPVEIDTLWCIFSMIKPVTSVAAIILLAEGGFRPGRTRWLRQSSHLLIGMAQPAPNANSVKNGAEVLLAQSESQRIGCVWCPHRRHGAHLGTTCTARTRLVQTFLN